MTTLNFAWGLAVFAVVFTVLMISGCAHKPVEPETRYVVLPPDQVTAPKKIIKLVPCQTPYGPKWCALHQSDEEY